MRRYCPFFNANSKKQMHCAVCRLHVHTRCVQQVNAACKWASIDDVPAESRSEMVCCLESYVHLNHSVLQGDIHHQWTIGNFGNNKCEVCKKTCGSSIRLQDYRCLWCKITVHGVCRLATATICNLGRHRVSILPVCRQCFMHIHMILTWFQPTAIVRRRNAPAGLSHWIVWAYW